MNPVSILLVDDNPTFLSIATRFLQTHDNLLVVGAVQGGQEALAQAQDSRPDVILVDLLMPDLPGWKLIPRLRKMLPQAAIIALTLHPPDAYREVALAAGADDFVLKRTMSADLLPAIWRSRQTDQAHAKPEQTTLPEPKRNMGKNGQELTKVRVLIVEDDFIIDMDIETQLKNLGYSVVGVASSGAEALQKVAETEPDLVLMDIKLKGEIDGIATATQIQARFDLPVIYLMAYANEEILQRAKMTEPFGYLIKPFEARELGMTIDMALHKYEIEKTLRKSEQWLDATLNSIGEGVIVTNKQDRIIFPVEEINLAWSVADQVAGVVARSHLAQPHRYLITAIEQAAESISITDTEGDILYVNPAFEQITGYSFVEVVGQQIKIADKNSAQGYALNQEMWTTIRTGQVWRGRLANKRKDGTLYTVEVTINPVRDQSGAIVNYLGIQRDVTHELKLEVQYNQAQKMEAIGRLTAGIAHDFNNLLTAINGFAGLMQAGLPADSPFLEMAGIILHSGQRATNLVRQLLAFSRKQVIEPQVLEINKIVTEIDKMLQRIIGEDIHVKTVLTSNLWWVKIDPTQVEQIIVNLAVNARDAMPDGGELTIETSNVVLNEGYTSGHLGGQPNEYVLLAISDTGFGMSQEVQAHLFEPFFTTKEPGKGTGLGLATVYGIVKQNKGDIWIYSEEGQGSTFKIYLPRAKEAKQQLRCPEVEQKMPTGSEVIILVEDDAEVRELARQVLAMQGYTLLEAKDGREALRLAARHSDPIDLLLTDVVMPGLNGRVLSEQLAQTQPDLKTLFMSGYTDETIVHHGVLIPDMAFLPKPFSFMALAHKVRAVLDAPAPTRTTVTEPENSPTWGEVYE